MNGVRRRIGRGWRHLWCVPQAVSSRARDGDWNGMRINAIGSAWGRDHPHPGLGTGPGDWSATIVAELSR